jgi:hypothetical protein
MKSSSIRSHALSCWIVLRVELNAFCWKCSFLNGSQPTVTMLQWVNQLYIVESDCDAMYSK